MCALRNENAVWGPKGRTALNRERLMNMTYQMSYKFGSATKATREIPVLKYAKKLGNQVLSGLKYLRDGMVWDGKECVLEYPVENAEDESDNRPYVREVRSITLSFLSSISKSTKLHPQFHFIHQRIRNSRLMGNPGKSQCTTY